jgi:hypothetical protein
MGDTRDNVSSIPDQKLIAASRQQIEVIGSENSLFSRQTAKGFELGDISLVARQIEFCDLAKNGIFSREISRHPAGQGHPAKIRAFYSLVLGARLSASRKGSSFYPEKFAAVRPVQT